MRHNSSRRRFLTAGLGLPAAGLASNSGSTDSPLKVHYRPLGKTGLKVSALSFGAKMASDVTVLERAVDLGINCFDTARSYRNNERMLGAALKGKRDKVILATKSHTFSRSEALRDLETSLKELGTDYLDIWFLHGKNQPKEITEELLEAQLAAKKAGKIRFAGVSFHFNMPDVLPYVVKLGTIDVALVSYNFTLGPEVGEAISAARRHGLGIVVMKVMAGGYARIRRGDRLYGQDPDKLTAKLKQRGAMVAALKWALQNKSVDSALVGISDFEELEQDIRATSEPFTEQDRKILAWQLERIRPLYCRACGACTGVCEKGVRVADTLRHLMYAEGYRRFDLAREAFLDQPAEARAVRCRDCATCSIRCPNGVDVRANLIRAQALFG